MASGEAACDEADPLLTAPPVLQRFAGAEDQGDEPVAAEREAQVAQGEEMRQRHGRDALTPTRPGE